MEPIKNYGLGRQGVKSIDAETTMECLGSTYSPFRGRPGVIRAGSPLLWPLVAMLPALERSLANLYACRTMGIIYTTAYPSIYLFVYGDPNVHSERLLRIEYKDSHRLMTCRVMSLSSKAGLGG